MQNPYEVRLQDFSSCIFSEPSHAFKGKWSEYFRARLGFTPEKIILEIGCYTGTFLTEMAAANPRCAFIGIDWKFKAIYRAGQRIHQTGLLNTAVIRAHAQILSEFFSSKELDHLLIFFPDPWAKTSQIKHRLLQESFLLDVAKLLKPIGKIFIKTDHPGYFQWILSIFNQEQPQLEKSQDTVVMLGRGKRVRQAQFRQTMGLAELPKPSLTVQHHYKIATSSINYWKEVPSLHAVSEPLFRRHQTLFEKRFVQEGLPIYYLELQMNG